MKIKESPKEIFKCPILWPCNYKDGEFCTMPEKCPCKDVFIPSTIKGYVTHHEKAWEREMRHRLMALEQRLDEIEELIKDLHPKELGV